jgi:hypothetical protein
MELPAKCQKPQKNKINFSKEFDNEKKVE